MRPPQGCDSPGHPTEDTQRPSKTPARSPETKSCQTSWLTASGVLPGSAESLIKTTPSSAATSTHAPASHLLLRNHSKPSRWLESTCPPRLVTVEARPCGHYYSWQAWRIR